MNKRPAIKYRVLVSHYWEDYLNAGGAMIEIDEEDVAAMLALCRAARVAVRQRKDKRRTEQ